MSSLVKTYGRAKSLGRAFGGLLALVGLVWLGLQPLLQTAPAQAGGVPQAGFVQTSGFVHASSGEAALRLAAASAFAGGSASHMRPQAFLGRGPWVVPTAAASALAGEPAQSMSRALDEDVELLSPALSAAPDEAGEAALASDGGARAPSARRLPLPRLDAAPALGVSPHDRPPRAEA